MSVGEDEAEVEAGASGEEVGGADVVFGGSGENRGGVDCNLECVADGETGQVVAAGSVGETVMPS